MVSSNGLKRSHLYEPDGPSQYRAIDRSLMPNILVSVRLSSELAAMLEQAVKHLECSPSGLVEALLERGEARRKEILRAVPQGPFTEKRNFRLPPEAVRRLGQLAGDTADASASIRRVLVYFLSTPEFDSFRSNGDGQPWPRTATGSRTVPRVLTGQRYKHSPAHPIAPFVVFLVLLVPLLAVAIKHLIAWLRNRAPDQSTSPRGNEEPPDPPSPP
jgi:hypothetical protein